MPSESAGVEYLCQFVKLHHLQEIVWAGLVLSGDTEYPADHNSVITLQAIQTRWGMRGIWSTILHFELIWLAFRNFTEIKNLNGSLINSIQTWMSFRHSWIGSVNNYIPQIIHSFRTRWRFVGVTKHNKTTRILHVIYYKSRQNIAYAVLLVSEQTMAIFKCTRLEIYRWQLEQGDHVSE